MSDFEEEDKRIKGNIYKIDELLTFSTAVVKITPYLQSKKDDEETKLRILHGIPEDIAEELASKWLLWEKESDFVFNEIFPTHSDISPSFIKAVESSSGSATPYIFDVSEIMGNYQIYDGHNSDWQNDLSTILNAHSVNIQQREYLPRRLDLINENLGKQFNVASGTFIKCKNNMIEVNLAALQLRNVLSQLWGGLSEKARNKTKDKIIKRMAFSKHGDREFVSEVLSNEAFTKVKISEYLKDGYSLHEELSESNFGKNPLSEDFQRLNSCFNKWITLIDGISGIAVYL